MLDKRKAKMRTAKLFKTGYLRLSSDLIPEKKLGKKFLVEVMVFPEKKELQLHLITEGKPKPDVPVRRASYSNGKSKCPIISIKAALGFMQIPKPKKALEFPVVVGAPETWLVIQF